MFDIFEADVVCPNCKYSYRASAQTKDFGSLMDLTKQGESVKKWKILGMLYWDNCIFYGSDKERAGKLTKKKLAEFKVKHKGETVKGHDGRDIPRWLYTERDYLRIDEILGERQSNYSNVENATFNCYDICPKCKTWWDGTGIIKDFIFIGIKDLRSEK